MKERIKPILAVLLVLVLMLVSLIKKRIKLIVTVLLALLLLLIPLFGCSPRGAAAAFALDRAGFLRAAQTALANGSGEGVKRPFGVLEVSVRPSPYGRGECVEFWMGGAGLGPSTSYWGVTFSEYGPTGFQSAAVDYAPDGDGWFWAEPGGDNWSRVTPLEENWYLYEMHF